MSDTDGIERSEAAKARRRYLVRKGALLRRPLTGPLEVCIIPTYRCNYGCVFCALEYETPGKKPDLPAEKIEAVLVDLAELDAEQVSFTGGGEPFMYKPIDGLVRRSRELGLEASICTNGYLLTEERIVNFARLGVHISISLNGPTPESYVANHPGTKPEDFHRITASLRRFVEIARTEGGPGSFISLNFVLTNINWDLVPRMHEISREIGASQVQFRLIQPRPVHRRLFLSDEQLARAREDIRAVEIDAAGDPSFAVQVAEILRSERREAPCAVLVEDPFSIGDAGSIDELERVPCIEGYIASYIDSDGIVFPCCLRSTSIENHYMGNVNEQRFADIWRGESYQGFRAEAFDMGRAGIDSGANSCAYCPKAKAFLYMVDELAPGNLAYQQAQALRSLTGRLAPLETALGLRSSQQPMPQEGFKVKFHDCNLPREMSPSEEVKCEVTFSNAGTIAWRSLESAGAAAVGLSYHVLDSRGRMFEFDGHLRTYLPNDLLPGETARLPIAVTAPSKAGRYLIEFTLIQETVSWFEMRGAETLRAKLKVR